MIGVGALFTLGVALMFGGRAPQTTAEQIDGAKSPAAAPQSLDTPALKQGSAFDLNAPEFAKEKKSVEQRQLDGGGSEDKLTLGQFAGAGPFLRLDLRQQNGERKAADFFLDLTRHATGAGLATMKIGQPSQLVTRLGAFEAADIKLSLTSPDGTPVERSCVALRSAGKGPLDIAGFVCGVQAKPFDRKVVGCIVDRLVYVGGNENPALEQLFKASDGERMKSCGGAVATAPVQPNDKTSWIEAHSRAPSKKLKRCRQSTRKRRGDPLPLGFFPKRAYLWSRR